MFFQNPVLGDFSSFRNGNHDTENASLPVMVQKWYVFFFLNVLLEDIYPPYLAIFSLRLILVLQTNEFVIEIILYMFKKKRSYYGPTAYRSGHSTDAIMN